MYNLYILLNYFITIYTNIINLKSCLVISIADICLQFLNPLFFFYTYFISVRSIS